SQVETDFLEAKEVVHRRHVGGRVDQRRDLVLPGNFDKFFVADGPLAGRTVQEEHYRRAIVNSLHQFLAAADFDDPSAGVADGVIVADAMAALDNDFVLHARGVWDAANAARVAAGHAGSRAEHHGRGAARSDQGRFTAEQLR